MSQNNQFAPVREDHHQPMVYLYDVDTESHIGFRCDHCGTIFTVNMTPSVPFKYIQTNPGIEGRYVENKAHGARVRASKFQARVRRTFRRLLKSA